MVDRRDRDELIPIIYNIQNEVLPGTIKSVIDSKQYVNTWNSQTNDVEIYN